MAEQKSPFDLEIAIANWRSRMSNAGIKAPALLDELESHLRDEIRYTTRDGSDSRNAFDRAVQRMGDALILKTEFVKAGRARGLIEKLMIAICVVLVGFVAFLGGAAIILCYSKLTDRIMNAAAILCILGVACGWSRAVRFLPVISDGRKRTATGVACILGGMGLATLYCQVIMPHLAIPYDQQVPAAGFWMVFLLAIGFALGAGIEQAGRRAQARMSTN